MKRRVFTVFLLAIFSMGSLQAVAATPKAGTACKKAGATSGHFTCTKIDGKLKWKIVKKSQKITYSAATDASVADKQIALNYFASSHLEVKATSLTADICSTGKSIILIVGIPGVCEISLQQGGNIYFRAAKTVTFQVRVSGINLIDFQLPGALLLSRGTYLLSASASSNLPVLFTTSTPDSCTVMDTTLTLLQVGTCTVTASQDGAGFFPAADSVEKSVEISTDRVNADLPDTFTGFQIKPIYVVPSDGTDHAYDTNGYLSGILDEGNSYLDGQIGLTVPIDRSLVGYDILYLKSKYSTSYLMNNAQSSDRLVNDADVLMSEIKAMDLPGDNRKDYIFFIDVPGFDGTYCGSADRPGIAAVVALQNISDTKLCTGPSAPFFDNYIAKTWVHELIHNFGVTHTLDDPCDLMAGKPETPGICTATVKYTMDKERTRYVGASNQGQDLLKLRVWQGHTGDLGLQADCVLNPIPRSDGVPYAYCPTGTQAIGALSYCWSNISSVVLEEQINGAWVSLGSGNFWSQPWGSRITWSCSNSSYAAPWKELTVNAPGIRHYRWVVNGQIAEELNVIWVQ